MPPWAAGLLHPNALLGLLAAALWGGGDFGGSMAVKRFGGTVRGALQVVVLGHAVSLVALTLLARHAGTPLTFGAPMLWSMLGGAISGVALVAFYLALADGHMGSAAAVSGLICAALPAIVSAYTEGAPGWRRLLGFLLAGAAIWLIASSSGGASRRAMILSVAGGIGFGIYFIALKQGSALGILWPTAAARVGSLTTCGLLLAFFLLREHLRPAPLPVAAPPQLRPFPAIFGDTLHPTAVPRISHRHPGHHTPLHQSALHHGASLPHAPAPHTPAPEPLPPPPFASPMTPSSESAPELRSTSEPIPTVTLAFSAAALAWILTGAALDTGGNLSFIAATRAGRLDVAAVLASIYPAGTILLAAAILKEHTSRQQQLGMWLAVPAIALITL